MSRVQALYLACVSTTKGCCVVPEVWLLHFGLGRGFWAVCCGKPSTLSVVYFESLFFWHSLKVKADGEPLKQDLYMGDLFSIWIFWTGLHLDERKKKGLFCPLLALLMCYDGFNLFLCDPLLNFLLSIVHRTWQLSRGLPRDLLMGSSWKWKLTPGSLLTLFPPSFLSFHSRSLLILSISTAGRAQL